MNTLVLFSLMAGVVICFGLGAVVGAVLMHDSMEDEDLTVGADPVDEDPEDIDW